MTNLFIAQPQDDALEQNDPSIFQPKNKPITQLKCPQREAEIRRLSQGNGLDLKHDKKDAWNRLFGRIYAFTITAIRIKAIVIN